MTITFRKSFRRNLFEASVTVKAQVSISQKIRERADDLTVMGLPHKNTENLLELNKVFTKRRILHKLSLPLFILKQPENSYKNDRN